MDGIPMFLHHNQLKRRGDASELRFDHVLRPARGAANETRAVPGPALRLGTRTLYCTTLASRAGGPQREDSGLGHVVGRLKAALDLQAC
jgi:hypothetical protein